MMARACFLSAEYIRPTSFRFRDVLGASVEAEPFVAALDADSLSLIVMAGNRKLIDQQDLTEALQKADDVNGDERQEFVWGDFWILPLRQRRRNDMDRDVVPPLLGLLGVARQPDQPLELDGDQRDALWLLADRAAFALEDRQLQQRVFRSLENLHPQDSSEDMPDQNLTNPPALRDK